MTREEAIAILSGAIKKPNTKDGYLGQAIEMAIKALEQEPRKDEVILTLKEYGELVSSEFDNGYAKGYREALEQNDVLDKIKADIENLEICYDNADFGALEDPMYIAEDVLAIIDKYRENKND